MKKIILLFVIVCTIGTFSFAQLPNLIGYKATIDRLKEFDDNYIVKEGRLLDVRSYNKGDNIYTSASITGSTSGFDCEISSDGNGNIYYMLYTNEYISETHFTYLKETIVKLFGASYRGLEGKTTIYSWKNNTRYIYFKWANNTGTVVYK